MIHLMVGDTLANQEISVFGNLQKDVLALRSRLIELNAWPDGGDLFLSLMPHSHVVAEPIREKECAIMPQVVKDVLAGQDIGHRYPAFFQKLLLNATLRQAFLQAVRQETILTPPQQ